MTNQSDLQVLGDDVDTQIAAITQKPKVSTHADEGAAVGGRWDHDVASAVPPPPPPPPKPKILRGASSGGGTSATVDEAVRLMPKAQVLRVYQGGAPTTVAGHSDFAEAVAKMKLVGGEVWYSFKSMPTDAGFIALLADWASHGIKIRWCYNHEADNPSKNIVSATFVSQFNHLISVGNAHPSANVEEYSCFMAHMLTANHPHGDPEKWYVNARTLGFDCYVLANFPLVVAYAKAKGKPFILPEWGGGGKDDNAALVFAQAMEKMFQANPPGGAAWFNADGSGASTYLRNIPKTLAYLNSLI